MDFRESLLTPQEKHYTMLLDPAEQRLIYRLRQLVKEQCRGCLLMFETEGFVLMKLDKREKVY